MAAETPAPRATEFDAEAFDLIQRMARTVAWARWLEPEDLWGAGWRAWERARRAGAKNLTTRIYVAMLDEVRRLLRLTDHQRDWREGSWRSVREPMPLVLADPRDQQAQAEQALDVAAILRRVKWRPRYLLERVDLGGLSLVDAGRELGISGSRAGQIRTAALQLLRARAA